MKNLLNNIQALLYGGVIGSIISFSVFNWEVYTAVFDLNLNIALTIRHIYIAAFFILSILKFTYFKDDSFNAAFWFFILSMIALLTFYFIDIDNSSFEEVIFNGFYFMCICIFLSGSITSLISAKIKIKGVE